MESEESQSGFGGLHATAWHSQEEIRVRSNVVVEEKLPGASYDGMVAGLSEFLGLDEDLTIEFGRSDVRPRDAACQRAVNHNIVTVLSQFGRDLPRDLSRRHDWGRGWCMLLSFALNGPRFDDPHSFPGLFDTAGTSPQRLADLSVRKAFRHHLSDSLFLFRIQTVVKATDSHARSTRQEMYLSREGRLGEPPTPTGLDGNNKVTR